jgi:hypothetical protein
MYTQTMCDFGNPNVAQYGRYDGNYAWDPVYQKFFGPENVEKLVSYLQKRGYTTTGAGIKPFMFQVFALTNRTGFDPSLCSRSQIDNNALNAEFIDYFIPIAENQQMSIRSYILDQQHPGRGVPIVPVATRCQQQVFLNSRFPE